MTAAHKAEQAEQPQTDSSDDPWVSINAAAEILGKARNSVLMEALDGKVRHQKVAGRRFFHRDDLEKLRANPTAPDADDE